MHDVTSPDVLVTWLVFKLQVLVLVLVLTTKYQIAKRMHHLKTQVHNLV